MNRYEWQMYIDREVGTNRNDRNKIRFKCFFSTEDYCKVNKPITNKVAYAEFKCRMETIRHLGQPLDARILPFRPNYIENEQHVFSTGQHVI